MRGRLDALAAFYARDFTGFLGRLSPEEAAEIRDDLSAIRAVLAILGDPVSEDSTSRRVRELRRLQRALERAGVYTRVQLGMHRDTGAPLLAAYRRPLLDAALDAGVMSCPRCGASMLSQVLECTVCSEHWRVCPSCRTPTTGRDRCTICDARRR